MVCSVSRVKKREYVKKVKNDNEKIHKMDLASENAEKLIITVLVADAKL